MRNEVSEGGMLREQMRKLNFAKATEKEIDDFIVSAIEKERKSFQQVTDDLESGGYESRRLRKPLTLSGVQARYYKLTGKDQRPTANLRGGALAAPHSAERKVQLIRDLLSMDLDDKTFRQLVIKALDSQL